MNVIIQTDGFGANGSTAVYQFDIGMGSWSTLGTARPAGGAGAVTKSQRGCFDGSLGYVILNDRNLYSHDPNGDTWSSALVAIPGTHTEYSLASDGTSVFIVGVDNTTSVGFWRYDIATAGLDTIGVTTVIASNNGAAVWDYDNTLYLLFTTPGNVGSKKWELWSYTISTASLTSLYSNQAITYSPSTADLLRAAAFADSYLFFMTQSTPFYRVTLADGTITAMTAVPGTPSSIAGAGLWRTETDKILAMTNGGAAGYFKQYTISGDSWGTLADCPSTLGTWAGGYYTIPISDPFAHCDSGGTPVGVLDAFPDLRIGGDPDVQTYYFKNLLDTAAAIVTPDGDANTTFEVSDDPGGPWTASHDFGAKTAGDVTTYYIRGTATGGIPETRTLRVRLTDS